jgi:hypothetical protein
MLFKSRISLGACKGLTCRGLLGGGGVCTDFFSDYGAAGHSKASAGANHGGWKQQQSGQEYDLDGHLFVDDRIFLGGWRLVRQGLHLPARAC